QLGIASLPVMRLRQSADRTVDEWFPVVVDHQPPRAHLRLILHFRQQSKRGGDEPESSVVPECFRSRYCELTRQCEPLPTSPTSDLSKATSLLEALSGCTAGPPSRPAPAQRLPEVAAQPDGAAALRAELVERLEQCRAAVGAPRAARGGRQATTGASDEELSDGDAVLSDEPCRQLQGQNAAMEREREELQDHWNALRRERETKLEALEQSKIALAEARDTARALETEAAKATEELKGAQQEAAEQLLGRRRLQREMEACAEAFQEEISAQRSSGELLRQKRAGLREAAVGLGQELQACVGTGDLLVAEGLELAGEAAAFNSECAELQGRRERLDESEAMREAVALCERLQAEQWTACGEADCAGAEAAEERRRLTALLDQQSRQLLVLRQAAARLTGEAGSPSLCADGPAVPAQTPPLRRPPPSADRSPRSCPGSWDSPTGAGDDGRHLPSPCQPGAAASCRTSGPGRP
ncbi:unnamed protein product, partial [Prorocentrum cordatum]